MISRSESGQSVQERSEAALTLRKKRGKKKQSAGSLTRTITAKLFGVARQPKGEKNDMNKAVTFLSNLGQMILRGFGLLPQVTTVLESSSGQPIPVLDKLSQIGNLVILAEGMIEKVMGPGNGILKATAIGPFVAQVVMSSELVAGREIDPAKLDTFNAKCQDLGGIVGDILNCLKPNSTAISTDKLPAPPQPVGVVIPAARLAAAAAPAAPSSNLAPAVTAKTAQAIEAEIPGSPAVAAAIHAGLDGLPAE